MGILIGVILIALLLALCCRAIVKHWPLLLGIWAICLVVAGINALVHLVA